MSTKKELVCLPCDIPYKKTQFKITLNGKEKLVLNDQLYVIGFENSEGGQTGFILGDRLSKVNGVQMKTKAEATAALANAGEVSLEILRRSFTKPIPQDRFIKVIKKGETGFAYFIIECVKLPTDTTNTFGFTLKVVKNRAFIMAVEPKSIAARFFAIGDALMDLDSVPIPMGDADFIKNYAPKFFKQGRFTTIVERAASPAALKMANSLMKLLAPQESDVHMTADAIAIGKQAAIMHRNVFRKLTPTSIITGEGKMDRTKMEDKTMEESGAKKVKIAPKMLVTTIGSDVDEDDSLRPVKKKSHAAYDNYDDY